MEDGQCSPPCAAERDLHFMMGTSCPLVPQAFGVVHVGTSVLFLCSSLSCSLTCWHHASPLGKRPTANGGGVGRVVFERVLFFPLVLNP